MSFQTQIVGIVWMLKLPGFYRKRIVLLIYQRALSSNLRTQVLGFRRYSLNILRIRDFYLPFCLVINVSCLQITYAIEIITSPLEVL